MLGSLIEIEGIRGVVDAIMQEIEILRAPKWQVAAALDGVDVGSESIIKVVLSEAWIVGHSIIQAIEMPCVP